MASRKKVKITDEFATAMQQLSAEAEQTLLPDPMEDEGSEGQLAEMNEEFRALNERVRNLETSLSTRLDKLAVANASTMSADLAQQLNKMDEHMAALRSTETVNQKLFNSLHEELIKYRDNFLHESLQKPFIRDLIVLFDDLTSLSSQLKNARDTESGHGPVGLWCDNLENAIHALIEVLHRLEVNAIEPKDIVDRALHRVVSYEPADYDQEDGQIIMRLKRGFMWRDQLLRPEEVVAKRYS